MSSRFNALLALLASWVLAAPAFASAGSPAEWDALRTTSAIEETLRAHLFNPAAAQTPAFRQTLGTLRTLAEAQPTREAYLEAFNRAWADGPFSHVRLDPARASAADTAEYLDTLRVGGRGATLAWRDDVAVLTVTTMMGADTIEQIEAAYRDIGERGARALVVDLRDNRGGAFAVVPLVSHALAAPLDAGVFLGAKGRSEAGAAATDGVADLPPWKGWSIRAFWADVEREGRLRIRFEPQAPVFAGPVYVLTSRKTASAAELAANALQAGGRAIVVGERSAGQMLSQKMYDVPGGLLLSLPVADYVARQGGRIEGRGVWPDVAVPAAEALDRALALAADATPRGAAP